MDCFNYLCPFRQNTTSSLNRCECVMCPHRIETPVTYVVSNRTLTADEIAEKDAVEAWNRRAGEEDKNELVER